MIHDRAFTSMTMMLLALVGCGPAAVVTPADDGVSTSHALKGTRVRLMAANISTGAVKPDAQTYNLGEGARIFSGTHPDVVMIQEFNYLSNSDADIRGFVDRNFGTEFSYVRGGPAAKGIPNGVISRYPVVASGDWADPNVSNRAFTWAHLDLPGPTDLWAVSVHLLTANAATRDLEASALVANIQAQVPAGDYLVIGGDFNTSTRTEPALTTFSRVVATGAAPPADAAGNSNTSSSRTKPYDWVLVSPNLQTQATPTVVGSSTFTNGLVVDTRVFSPITDLAPALATDSAAPGMQHMAVVRDFDVDFGSPAGVVSITAPASGSVVWAQSPVTIMWSALNVAKVDLLYSPDGNTFTTIASGLDGASGAWSWVTPATPSPSARLRVAPVGLGAVGEVAISVVTPLHVDAPNGGETYVTGSPQSIQWVAAPGIANVDIAFSADGVTFTTLASGVSAAAGSWSWVPSSETSAGLIRVSATGGSALADTSDAPFAVISPKSLHVDSPNGGEVLTAGQTVTIRWSSNGIAFVNIGYAANGVDFVKLNPISIDASSQGYTWLVPNTATTAAVIRVSDETDSTFSDTSDAPFAVSVPVVPGSIVLNEILANEPLSDTRGEFVELVNVGGTAVDLSGYTLSDSAQVRHRFAAGTVLAPGATLVVFGGLSAVPPGLTNAVAASTGALGLNNNSDVVSVANATGQLVDTCTYTTALASVDGVSMNRSPDRTPGAPFVLHTKLATASSSPGRGVDGSP